MADDHQSRLEESDDTTADHSSQAMSESASVEPARVEVLSAEVRVVQVGNAHITRSMYRQLDEAPLVRFEPFGRVRDTKHKPREGVLQLARIIHEQSGDTGGKTVEVPCR
jgi:hypothetical protein